MQHGDDIAGGGAYALVSWTAYTLTILNEGEKDVSKKIFTFTTGSR